MIKEGDAHPKPTLVIALPRSVDVMVDLDALHPHRSNSTWNATNPLSR